MSKETATTTTLDEALLALKTYDWGADRNQLNPIDQAINATHGDAAARAALEKGLVDVLAGGISRSAQDYVCRKLRVVGTAQSVNALASLLLDEETSHIARYALEAMPGEEAADALRNALRKAKDAAKLGIAGSLGRRRDEQSVNPIAKLVGKSDVETAQAAAQALGLIGTPSAAKKLGKAVKKAKANKKIPVASACLLCAEQLLADGETSTATGLYEQLCGNDLPEHIKVAAKEGLTRGR